MNLFTSRLDAERLARAADPATRAADLDSVIAPLQSEAIGLTAGTRRIAYAGSETPRERVWLQVDSWTDDVVAAIVAWAALESLSAERPARYRVPVVGRARVAVAYHEDALSGAAPSVVPLLDAGALGAQPPLLDALRRFAPSLVVHVQDWSAARHAPLGARLVESFWIDPNVHVSLPARGAGRRFSRERRAFRTAAAGPDWALGARTPEYVRRLGLPFPELASAGELEPPDGHAAHAVAPGRYVPTLPYRRLGGGNLGELALALCGAPAITLQMRGGSAPERASLALAVAEAAIVQRMGLAQQEGGE